MKKLLIFWLVLVLTMSITACTPKAKDGGKKSCSDIITAPSKSSTADNPDDSDSSNEHTEDISDESYHAQLPSAYETVITEYKELIELRLSLTGGNDDPEYSLTSPDQDLSLEWCNMFIELTLGIDSPSVSSFGYVLKDINCDGTNELFIVREDNMIFAVYTLYDGVAHLLGAYWPRYECSFLESGELFIEGSGGAFVLDYKVQTLDENSDNLVTVANFGYDISEHSTAPDMSIYYYEEVNGEKLTVDEARFNELFELYRDMIVVDFCKNNAVNYFSSNNQQDTLLP